MRAVFISSLICSLMAVSACSVTGQNGSEAVNRQASPAAINYPQFLKLSEKVEAYREDRLVGKSEFLDMASETGTLILDTRSKAAFDQGHIDGAVHLNFSDFTEDKLAKVIGRKDRKILIYCNNNFSDNENPFLKKSVELALNIPTFINLYGYGYKNVFELKDSVSMKDPAMKIVPTRL